MSKHREITVRSLVAFFLAAVMAVSIAPVPADAATSGEIQKEIDGSRFRYVRYLSEQTQKSRNEKG